ncbi:unnamed protein product [Urochloa humidicola]
MPGLALLVRSRWRRAAVRRRCHGSRGARPSLSKRFAASRRLSLWTRQTRQDVRYAEDFRCCIATLTAENSELKAKLKEFENQAQLSENNVDT